MIADCSDIWHIVLYNDHGLWRFLAHTPCSLGKRENFKLIYATTLGGTITYLVLFFLDGWRTGYLREPRLASEHEAWSRIAQKSSYQFPYPNNPTPQKLARSSKAV